MRNKNMRAFIVANSKEHIKKIKEDNEKLLAKKKQNSKLIATR